VRVVDCRRVEGSGGLSAGVRLAIRAFLAGEVDPGPSEADRRAVRAAADADLARQVLDRKGRQGGRAVARELGIPAEAVYRIWKQADQAAS
jgi:hypothetical protein